MTGKRMTAEDLYGFKWVSEPQLSPDGCQVAFVLSHIDKESDEYRSAIYVVPFDGSSEPRRFTYGPKHDHTPRWSPDGTQLLFISDREGKGQVYVMPAHGGEARKVTSAENGVASAAWSPDGQTIAFVSTVGVNRDEELKDILAYHYTEAHFKNDGEGMKRGRKQVFVQALDSQEARQLTQGDDDYTAPVWSPDGQHIVAVSDQTEDRPFGAVSDIYLISVEDGSTRKLTPSRGPSFSPTFSPDGRLVAYFGHQNPPDTGRSTKESVWIVPVEGGEPRNLTADWDRGASNDVNSDSRWGAADFKPVWSEDGESVYFVGSDWGAAQVFSVGLDDGVVRAVTTGERSIDGFSIAAGELVLLAAEALNPGDLYARPLEGGKETRLTRVNEEFLSGFELSKPEEVWIQSTEGACVQGWVMKPVSFREGEQYPLIIEVHGGPHTLYGYAFFHEFQVLAARGYGVLYTNPRGSTGYGQDYAACIVGHWGERDYADVMAALDWAVSQRWVDPERVGITGGSYGGFMTNWAVAHTDRFRAAVTARSVTNWTSFYGTSDIGPFFAEWQVGGTPWTNPGGYARMSPISYVENVHTPLLILHSEGDHRCPIEQAEQLFVSLKRLGVETEFIRFPQEHHGLSRVGKPKRRVERLHCIVDWFERHMPPNESCGA